ncbi:hypothetical protein EMIHUDRAFT_197951 [Emiliania huxleyi CCMP1516]|uniref:Protein-tyrosine sulfotransferase n=2 Tax=Emiliania huxleyi TaxID=2903 RepID=A0A0D3IE05_EMIH1|nr:hypothetical protein EMIHUDRAFT_197951 [Emiliania huxleyi CCMP1516]EOD09490.1 hypothetical protein EMIHUDRAFT_197951 [Emiliania huxleyi CCMP1516]|eukprot:XP_005761919.1 hypothetical protein EMIHUDRAFT_197951 [Emiliania huxleyi CCMP1516]
MAKRRRGAAPSPPGQSAEDEAARRINHGARTALQAVAGLSIYSALLWLLGAGDTPPPARAATCTEVDAALSRHTLLHVAGSHRGGTTLLASLLAAHPAVHPFALRREGIATASGLTGPMSEGLFWQPVYDQLDLAQPPLPWRLWRGAAAALGLQCGSVRLRGMSTFALATGAHETEANESGVLTTANRRALFAAWARFWPILGEEGKSPSHVMRWRSLLALWRLGAARPPLVRFLFISRHPLAVAAAQRRWADSRGRSILQPVSLDADADLAARPPPEPLAFYSQPLVTHWLVEHETLASDLTAVPAEDAALGRREPRLRGAGSGPTQPGQERTCARAFAPHGHEASWGANCSTL